MPSSLTWTPGQEPAEAVGIDEFRCGAPANAADPDTGQMTQTRSQSLTHLLDLGAGSSLGLAQGRTAEAEKDLLAGHAARLRYLAIYLSASYRSGAPADLTLIADAFHPVQQLAYRMKLQSLSGCPAAPS